MNNNIIIILCTICITAFVTYFIMKNIKNKQVKPDNNLTIYTEPIKNITENFLTFDECSEIIKSANNQLTKTINGIDSYGNLQQHISFTAQLELDKTDGIQKCVSFAEKLTGINKSHFEPAIITKYELNGSSRYVSNSCNPYSDNYKNCLTNINDNGGRQYTMIVFLNDNYVGGEIHFAEIDKVFKKSTGSLLLFNNFVKDSVESNIESIYGVTPIIHGVKWILTLFIRNNVYDPNQKIAIIEPEDFSDHDSEQESDNDSEFELESDSDHNDSKPDHEPEHKPNHDQGPVRNHVIEQENKKTEDYNETIMLNKDSLIRNPYYRNTNELPSRNPMMNEINVSQNDNSQKMMFETKYQDYN